MAISNANESDASISNVVVEMAKINNGRIQAVESQEEQPSPKQRTKFRLYMIVVAEFLSLFIAALDQTIIATSVPTMVSELNSASGYTWIGGAYLLASSAASPIWAKLSDIWGRKPIHLTAVVVFAVGSIICATASTMRALIAGRAIQGSAAGALIQLCTITLSDLFSLHQRTLVLGAREIMWAIAAGVGPIMGGSFTQLVSWRWNFWINLPVCGVTFVLLLIFLDVHNPKTKMRDGLKAIDWLGSLTVLGFILMLLIGLDLGGTFFPWSSPRVVVLIVLGCFLGVLFILNEKHVAKHPLVPLRVFRKASNSACLVIVGIQGMVFIAGEYYLPLYFQAVKSATPIKSGLYILPLVIMEAVVGFLCGIYIHRTGRYVELIWAGFLIATLGTGLYIHLGVDTSLGEVIAFQIIAGTGMGCLFEAPIIALHAFVEQDEVATASATLGSVRNLWTSTSVVIGGVVLQNGMDIQQTRLMLAGLPQTLLSQYTGKDAVANAGKMGQIADSMQQFAVKSAFAWSMRNMWIMYTVISACGLIAAFFVSKGVLSKEHVETQTGIKEKRQPPAETDA